jgi:hypothetical protein
MNNCTLCNGELVNIIYGYPTPKLIEMAKTDGIVLGGTPKGFRPTHYCHACQEQFPQNDPAYPDFSYQDL